MIIILTIIVGVWVFVLYDKIARLRNESYYLSSLASAYYAVARKENSATHFYNVLLNLEKNIDYRHYDRVMSALCIKNGIPFELGKDGMLKANVRKALAERMLRGY